ncbi:MFS transporter [Dactylosporangium sp. CA-139114]|uniref:MFS transporter n=1 Tax=Dactylosporangium sp. CA-139114 TaxID=3239931 RepID=UPI003D95FCC3
MTKTQRLVGALLCMFTIVLAVLDQNIVSAAVVPIVRDLDPAHGVEHVAWLVAAFALASTVVPPLYGRLTDAFGAKPVWLSAVAVFLLGSVLCGAAQDMTQLIAFRAVQGIGAGGLMSVTMVVLANLADEPGTDRGKGGGMGGLFAGVGMAIGPFIGGLFADHGNWRGIFYVNVPLGLIVIAGGLFAIRIPRETRTRHTDLDLPGAALAGAFAAALLLVCEWGGQQYRWTSPTILALIAAGVVSLVLFVWRESVAAHPVLPLSLLRDRTVRGSYAIQLLIGAAMIGAMIHLMLYLQVARGVSASESGLYLAFMAVGLTASGMASARLRLTTRASMLVGTSAAAAALGAILLCVHENASLWAIRGALVLLGVGFGQLIGRLITVVQDAAPAHQLGVATTGIRFFQSLGTAVGAAALGSVLSRVYESQTGTRMSTTAITHQPAALGGFVTGIEVVFTVAGAIVVVALLVAARLHPLEHLAPEPESAPNPAIS